MTISDASTGREPAGSDAEADRWPVTRAARGPGRRAALPRSAAFWLMAGVSFLLFFAAAAPSPLYGVYQAQWRFSATTLTAVFAAYALLLLVTLLVFGSASDYLGRRRVILGPDDGRRRLRVVPGGARCRAAVRRPGTARRRRRHREQCPRRRADRPATRGQRNRAGCHHRCQPAGPGRGSARHQRAGPVRACPHPPDLVAAARRLPGRGRRSAGDAGDRAGTAGRAGRASASCGGAPAGTEDVRDGPVVPDRGVDDQRVLPLPWTVAGRAGAPLAGPAVGRPGDLPARRDRRRGVVCVPPRQRVRGHAGRLPGPARRYRGDARRDPGDVVWRPSSPAPQWRARASVPRC